MLKLLARVIKGNSKVDNKDLPLLARYFPAIAAGASAALLERVWVHVSKPQKPLMLLAALHTAAESGNIGALSWLLTQAPEPTDINFYMSLFDESGGIQERAALSGSIEAFDMVMAHAAKVNIDSMVTGGFSKNSISAGIFGVRHKHMLDHVIAACERLGGEELVKSTLRLNSVALGRAAFNKTNTPAEDGFETHFIRAIHQYLGNEWVVDAVGKVFDDQFEDEIDMVMPPQRYNALLEEAHRLAGDEVITVVLDKIAEQAAVVGENDEPYPLPDGVMEMQDKLIAMGGELTAHLLQPEQPAFKDEARAIINGKHEGTNQPDEVSDALIFGWADEHMPNVEFETDVQKRAGAIKHMVKTGSKEDLQLLNEAHLKLGLPSIFPEALIYFTFSIAAAETTTHDKPGTFRLLLDFAHKNFGKAYAKTLLIQNIHDDRESSTISEMLDYAVAENDMPLIQEIISGMEMVGGRQLVLDILRQSNYVAVRSPITQGQGLITEYFLSLLPPEEHERAVYNQNRPHWAQHIRGEMRRSDLVQQIYSGRHRWMAMTGAEAPDDVLTDYSPYRFKEKLYQEVLEFTRVAGAAEHDGDYKINAYKLSVLFASMEEIENYLRMFASKWGNDSRKIVHDACLFQLPDDGLWDPRLWKTLVQKYGPDAYGTLRRAAEIEGFIDRKHFPQTLDEVNAVVALKSYRRAKENPELAELCTKYSRTEADFNKVLDWYKANRKTQDHMPDVTIDGETIGHPDYYLTRLAPDDLIGFFLGEKNITNCCQRIGDNGEAAALDGMSSPYSCFYVVRQKTDGQITGKADRIVGQSWAWVGRDNAIVWDSYERARSKHDRLVQPFIEQFAHEVVGKYSFTDHADGQAKTISSVQLGVDGQTPPLNVPHFATPSLPINYTGKYPNGSECRDSFTQYAITPMDHASVPRMALANVQELPNTEGLAKIYIAAMLKKFEDEYGIVVKTGIELECYAVGPDGVPSSQILDVAKVQADITAAGLIGRFEDENTVDYYGQYEATTKVDGPVETVETALKLRAFLDGKAQAYGLKQFDFSTMPFDGKEANGTHISLSLWDKNGAPLLGGINGSFTPLMEKVVNGMLDFQKLTVLPFAQHDADYLRFHNTEWSPGAVRAGNQGDQGISIRLANASSLAWLAQRANPQDVRIENRIAGGSNNLWVAMAATLASVEYALDKHFMRLQLGADAAKEMMPPAGTERLYARAYPLPNGRHEALQQLKRAQEIGLFQGPADAFFGAIIKQHDTAAIPVAPVRRTPHGVVKNPSPSAKVFKLRAA